MSRSDRSRRLLVGGALAVVVGLAVAAWLVGSRVQSSSQAAARAQPPTPSLLTAPVELRVLSATTITRADVVPAVSVAVAGPTLDAQGGAGSGIVTGVFVARGDDVDAAARVVEVAGRPVFVFAGSTPAFRTMRPGMSGGDVAQLQAGLLAAGCDAGTSTVYDDATKVCVEGLYTDAGYTTVRSSPSEVADLNAARSAVADAEDALAVANNALRQATEPSQRSGLARPESSAQQLAVEQQQRAVERARQALTELQAVSGAVVPFGEITFVPQLPARVDSVNATVGSPVGGGTTPAFGGSSPLVVLSTPGLEAHVSIPQSNRALLQDGTSVELLYEATGERIAGVVRSIGAELQTAPTSGVPAYPAIIDADLPQAWSGLNVRATFTAASTPHEVLVVPAAAVSSAADGQTRVQAQQNDGTVATIAVTTGLSADGFVEITPAHLDELHDGDLVVIGR